MLGENHDLSGGLNADINPVCNLSAVSKFSTIYKLQPVSSYSLLRSTDRRDPCCRSTLQRQMWTAFPRMDAFSVSAAAAAISLFLSLSLSQSVVLRSYVHPLLKSDASRKQPLSLLQARAVLPAAAATLIQISKKRERDRPTDRG
jgi:hypothetical protein